MRVEPELPEPSPAAAAHSRALVDRIAAEIAANDGWISFARYMELALYAPGAGYYAGGPEKFGAPGDFVTAPELSPLFGETLARQVAEGLGAAPADVLELGAGSGALACTLLPALQQCGALPERYLILEVSASLRERQRQRIAELPSLLAKRVQWLDRLPAHLTGVILANEVLDALPVHVVAWSDQGLYERGVVYRASGFEYHDRPLRDGLLQAAAARLDVAPPYVSEISLAVPALVRSLADRLEQGLMLLIDYGFGESEYYHPQRCRGTLMCHYRHRAHDDPFYLPGLQDITAHVDFSAVARAGVAAGLSLLGYTTQARFLINLGVTDLLARTPPEQPTDYLPLAAQAQKLLSPTEMGELFKVVALGRRWPSTLTGFTHGDLGRLL